MQNSSLRLISLIASATEMVCALGLEEALVGRSHECDFPESIKLLPVCTEPKFITDGSSYEIDQKVKAILQEGLSVYRVDAAKLDRLSPTHIITQDQCEVCAVSLQDVNEAACKLIHSQPQIISLKPNSLQDIWQDILRLGKALQAQKQAQLLIEQLKTRIGIINNTATALPKRPSVALIEWIEPLMAGGNWMPELIEMAGGHNLFGKAGKHSPFMQWEELIAANPDIIIVAPCGFDIQRTSQEMPAFIKHREFPLLKAAQQGQVFIADGNQYFNRPGPRIVESLEIMAEIIHPQVFHFGHQETGWTTFSAL